MKGILALIPVALLLTLAACGQSDEEKAKSKVCDARDDIQKQVSELQDLTLGTVTVDKVRSHLTSIRDDLQTIVDAQGDLSASDKQKVEKANDTFRSQMKALANDIGRSVSLEDAAKQLESDLSALGTAYKQAYAPIDCG
jgi:Zn-dependent oligopeptidase